jgi:uncharacterized membrane protein
MKSRCKSRFVDLSLFTTMEDPHMNAEPRTYSLQQDHAYMAHDDRAAMTAYFLFLAGYLLVLPGLLGALIAHRNMKHPDPLLRGHFQYQVQVFWFTAAWVVIGAITAFATIGWCILAVALGWSIYRMCSGLHALNGNRSV